MIAKKVTQKPQTPPFSKVVQGRKVNPNYPYIGDLLPEEELNTLAGNETLFLAAFELVKEKPDEFTVVVGKPTGVVIANEAGSIELPVHSLKLGQKLRLRKV